jgi:uncharacterized protein (TIGR03437 family)
MRPWLLSLLCVSLACANAQAYVRERTDPNGPFLFRTDNNNIQFRVNDQTAAGLTNSSGGTTITADSAPIQALQAATAAWSSIGTASITFAPLQKTSVSNSSRDFINLITFADTPANRSILGDALAVTNPVGVRTTGEMVDTDILFNPKLTYSTTFQGGTYDIQTIATHELGHTLGADHSGLLGATMFFAARAASGILSALTSDEIAFATKVYPQANAAASLGSISGKITLDNGQSATDALVAAVNPSTGVAVGGVTDASGAYTIEMIPPGQYFVYAEPMDGPVMPDQFATIAANPNTSFTTTFLGGNDSPQKLTVSAGQTASADLTVPSGTPAMNITLGAAATGQIASVNGGASALYPGQTFNFAIAGQGLDDPSINENSISFLGGPISMQGGSLSRSRTQSTNTPILLFTVNVAPNAQPGLYTLVIHSASGTAVYSGGAKILPPAPAFSAKGVVNGASFLGYGVTPGEIVSIFGAGLGPAAGVSGGIDPITGGLAASVGGVTVTFNGVPAPLFYASQNQLNVQVPFEVAGQAGANISVRYQASVSSPPVNVPVTSASAGIFQLPGSSQGVILNQDNTVNSPSNPAARGSVVQVYATGQGAVQPPLTTGQLAPALGPLSNAQQTVTATIGGQTADVRFAGMAPNFVGLLQVNVAVPSGAPQGSSVPIMLNIGGALSQPNVTLAIQ